MIILIGASASGKSTIEKALGYDRVISYTTRPIRPNEMDGVDYHYISMNEFNHKVLDGFFAESTFYNNWHYGMAKKDCTDNKLVVVESFGMRQLKKVKDIHITSFLIEAPERQRVCRMMKRGDDLMESFRRIISDQGSFNGIWDEIDYRINNEDGKLEQAIEEIKSILNDEKEIK
jgi:guanylate kinase